MDMTVYHKTEIAAKNEPAPRIPRSKGGKRDRRKTRRDRRRSVNEGVFVKLSTHDDRRSTNQERRRHFFVSPLLAGSSHSEPGRGFLDIIA